jgi:hypothetical protein
MPETVGFAEKQYATSQLETTTNRPLPTRREDAQHDYYEHASGLTGVQILLYLKNHPVLIITGSQNIDLII